MNKTLLIRWAAVFLLLFSVHPAWAQNKTISGTIKDSQDKSSIAGASILVKGTSIGTKSDAGGRFTLSVPQATNSLLITFIGYTNQEVSISDRSTVAISLVPSATALGEVQVVAIGYGTVRKRDLISSVATIGAKDFNKGLITSPDQLLQGKVAGLEITTNSGAPGSASTIVIRGNSSLRSGDAPLYVVDGVPLDGRTAIPGLNFSAAGTGASADVNPLLYINPNDIAQVDVLRDASAAAIYGSRGANGVIVITTKRASGTGTHVDFGTTFSTNTGYMKKYKVFDAAGFKSALSSNSLPNTYDGGSSTDAMKAITTSKLSQDYHLALSGGNENGHYRASFLGSKTQGFLKNTDLSKYIGTFGGQYKFLDQKLSIDFNLIAGHVTNNYALIGNTAGAGGDLISYGLQWNPTSSLYQKDGSYNVLDNSNINPLAVTQGFHDRSETDNYLGFISAGYKILPNLEYKFLYSINHGVGTRLTNYDAWLPIQGIAGKGAGIISTALLTSSTFTNTLNYHAKIASDLNLDAIAGYEYYKTNYATTNVSAQGFATNLTQSTRTPILYTSFLQSGSTQNVFNASADPNVEIQSFFGRVNLNYKDKYYIVGTVRDDGSNKFGSNKKYGVFPSVGIKWAIKNEDFLKDNQTLSSLELRASYGITGSQSFPAGLAQTQYYLGSGGSSGLSDIQNKDLQWEETTQYDAGANFGFLNNRFYGTLDFYNKNTTKLLFSSNAIQPVPNGLVSYLNEPFNLINKGVELSLGAAIIARGDVRWDIGINGSYNSNKLKNFTLNGHDQLVPVGQVNGQGVSGSFAEALANNHPADVFYLKQFSGFDSKGQQIIGNSPVFAGDPNPHVLAGLSTTVSYKKFSLNINGSGAFGYKIYNNTYNTITNISNLANGKNIASYALGTGESVSDGVAASTRYLESGNYFKLRNATLTYSVGNVGKVLKNLTVFAGGTNLFVITKFRGFDPEVNVDKSSGNGFPSRNIEYGPYPTPRTFSFGFNVGL